MNLILAHPYRGAQRENIDANDQGLPGLNRAMRPRAPTAHPAPEGAKLSALYDPSSMARQVAPSSDTSEPEVPVATHNFRAPTHATADDDNLSLCRKISHLDHSP